MLEKLFKSRATARVLALLPFGEPLHVRAVARNPAVWPVAQAGAKRDFARVGIRGGNPVQGEAKVAGGTGWSDGVGVQGREGGEAG